MFYDILDLVASLRPSPPDWPLSFTDSDFVALQYRLPTATVNHEPFSQQRGVAALLIVVIRYALNI